MGALGCTQRTRGSRRVGSALEWQGGRRVSAHVQPARNFQGVSSAPGSAQHEQTVQDVSFASGRRPQLQRLGVCKRASESENERREDSRERAGEAREGERTRVREIERERECTRVSVAKTRVGWPEEPQLRGVLMVRFRKSSNARRIAGMSQCVGYGVILRRTRRKMPPVRRGVTVRRKRVEEDGRGPEGSDFAAEEGGPDAEEGHEEVWDEVQEALSTMEHEEFDETAEADLCARSQASRPSSASSQASVRS